MSDDTATERRRALDEEPVELCFGPAVEHDGRARRAAPLGALLGRDGRLQFARLRLRSGVESRPLHASARRVAQLLGERHERVRVRAGVRVVVVREL